MLPHLLLSNRSKQTVPMNKAFWTLKSGSLPNTLLSPHSWNGSARKSGSAISGLRFRFRVMSPEATLVIHLRERDRPEESQPSQTPKLQIHQPLPKHLLQNTRPPNSSTPEPVSPQNSSTPQTPTVEARKLKRERPPIPNQRKKNTIVNNLTSMF